MSGRIKKRFLRCLEFIPDKFDVNDVAMHLPDLSRSQIANSLGHRAREGCIGVSKLGRAGWGHFTIYKKL